MRWIALLPHAAAPPEPAAAPVDAGAALAWWALRFTPQVAWLDDALVLEVSASERLFGGADALLQRLRHPVPPLQAPQAVAQGPSALAARARLQYPDRPLDHLPLHTLGPARAHLALLQRMGVRTWGQLRALPRGGLVRRFGDALLVALDQAFGSRPEVYPWLQWPEVFDMPLELPATVEAAPALMFGARRLLAQLQVWLQARTRGVLALELGWTLDARRANARHIDAHHVGDGLGRLVLRTAQATQDMLHLQRLMAERLARVQLPAPVLALRLRTLQTEALVLQTRSLLPDDTRPGDRLHQMAERLMARLGPDRVRRVQLQASHVPEEMLRWVPWQAEAPPPRGTARLPLHPDAALLPAWLLPQPQRLQLSSAGKGAGPHAGPQYHGPLVLLAGPHRIEAGWLEETPILRDYFIAQSEQAGLLWVFSDRLQAIPDWYLQGVFS